MKAKNKQNKEQFRDIWFCSRYNEIVPKIFHNYGLDIEFMIKKNKIEKKTEKEIKCVQCTLCRRQCFCFLIHLILDFGPMGKGKGKGKCKTKKKSRREEMKRRND